MPHRAHRRRAAGRASRAPRCTDRAAPIATRQPRARVAASPWVTYIADRGGDPQASVRPPDLPDWSVGCPSDLRRGGAGPSGVQRPAPIFQPNVAISAARRGTHRGMMGAPRIMSERVHRIGHLRPALEAAGVYERTRGYHALWFAATVALYAACIAALLGEPSLGVRAIAIVGAAIAVMQIGLFAHEVGHGAVTRSASCPEALGQLSTSCLIGFGFSHWQSTHPVHHNHPNTEGIDPDMESGGYALYDAATRRVHGLAARWQPAPLIAGFVLWGFGLRVIAVAHAIRRLGREPRVAIDLVCVAGHLAAWIGLGVAFGALRELAIDYADQ